MSRVTTIISFATVLIPTALAGFSPSSSNNLAVYWGQNSAGGVQQRLSHFCAKSEVNIIPISFLTNIKYPTLNLASASGECTAIPGSDLFYCSQLDEDIKECQTKYNKTILLSLGGATYTEGGFKNANLAETAARRIWDSFGPTDSKSNIPRPFGNAVVDGFDLDFEDTVHNMPAFANELRRLMGRSVHRPEIKKYLLTAAPQCVYPDVANHDMLNGVVPFDAIFVQFYNNYCGLQHFQRFSKKQRAFNFEAWDEWAKNVSKNPDVKVLLGVPASWSAAGSGYAAGKELQEIIAYSSKFESFGGVMLWDASQMEKNKGFLDSVASSLGVLPTKNAPIPTFPKPYPAPVPKPVLEIEPSFRKGSDKLPSPIGKPMPALAKLLEKEANKAYQLSAAELAQPKPPNMATAVIEKVNIAAPAKIRPGKPILGGGGRYH